MLTSAKKSPQLADVAIGANIRTLRVVRGLSQEKLGDAIGVTFQQVQKYEKGTNRVGGSRAIQIAAALGVRVAELYQGVEGEAQPTEGESIFAEASAKTPQELAMLRAFRNCTATARQAILNVAEVASL
jgi:transcriptional regulator with XRE-family HTH domain